MNQSKVSALKLFQPAPLCPDPREMPFSEVSSDFLDNKLEINLYYYACDLSREK
jgi:hypothetical protein